MAASKVAELGRRVPPSLGCVGEILSSALAEEDVEQALLAAATEAAVSNTYDSSQTRSGSQKCEIPVADWVSEAYQHFCHLQAVESVTSSCSSNAPFLDHPGSASSCKFADGGPVASSTWSSGLPLQPEGLQRLSTNSQHLQCRSDSTDSFTSAALRPQLAKDLELGQHYRARSLEKFVAKSEPGVAECPDDLVDSFLKGNLPVCQVTVPDPSAACQESVVPRVACNASVAAQPAVSASQIAGGNRAVKQQLSVANDKTVPSSSASPAALTTSGSLATCNLEVSQQNLGGGKRTREEILARYRSKRALRHYEHKVCYLKRKQNADFPPRCRGRFVKVKGIEHGTLSSSTAAVNGPSKSEPTESTATPAERNKAAQSMNAGRIRRLSAKQSASAAKLPPPAAPTHPAPSSPAATARTVPETVSTQAGASLMTSVNVKSATLHCPTADSGSSVRPQPEVKLTGTLLPSHLAPLPAACSMPTAGSVCAPLPLARLAQFFGGLAPPVGSGSAPLNPAPIKSAPTAMPSMQPQSTAGTLHSLPAPTLILQQQPSTAAAPLPGVLWQQLPQQPPQQLLQQPPRQPMQQPAPQSWTSSFIQSPPCSRDRLWVGPSAAAGAADVHGTHSVPSAPSHPLSASSYPGSMDSQRMQDPLPGTWSLAAFGASSGFMHAPAQVHSAEHIQSRPLASCTQPQVPHSVGQSIRPTFPALPSSSPAPRTAQLSSADLDAALGVMPSGHLDLFLPRGISPMAGMPLVTDSAMSDSLEGLPFASLDKYWAGPACMTSAMPWQQQPEQLHGPAVPSFFGS